MKNKIKLPLIRREKKAKRKKQNIRRTKAIDKVYYSPADSMSPGLRLVGLVLRTLVTYVGVLGIAAFICGAAGMSAEVYWQGARVSGGILALLAIPAALLAGVASLGKTAAVASLAAYCGGYLGITALLYGNPFVFTAESAVRVYNYALYTVSAKGFYSLGNYMVHDGYDYANAGYAASDPQRFAGAFLLCSLIGLVLYFCVQKKTRIIPLALFMTAIIAPVLTYNVADSNLGAGFTFAFIAGAVVLRVYDYRFAGSVERRRAKRDALVAKRAAAKKKREAARAEKKALRAEADKMFMAALEADMGMKRSRLARKAVYNARREAHKKEKNDRIAAERLAKKEKRDKLLASKKALREKKKKIAALRRANNYEEADRLKNKADRDTSLLKKTAKSEKKAARLAAKNERKKLAARRRAVSFAGGFAGFGAVACALLALWIPMSAVKGNFPVVDFINNRVQIVRTYVTAYLSGNDVDLNDLQAYGIDELTPRTLSFQPLEYDEDLKILRVETTGKSNVYLRSWIATDFDYATDSWSSADHDEVLAYRERFGADYSPDEITTAFNKYVYPSSAQITDDKTYKNFSRFGFTVQQVNVWQLRGNGRIMLIPAFANSDYEVMSYGKTDEAEYRYSKFFDGVYSSRFYNSGTGFSTISAVTAMNRADAGESMENSIIYYDQCYQAITTAENGLEGNNQNAVDSLEYRLQKSGIDYLGTSIADRYFNSMTEDEQKAYTDSVAAEKDYAAYASDTYTKTTGSQRISTLAEEIKTNAEDRNGDGEISRYELSMAVVDYFRSGYIYTLTPDAEGYSGEGSVLEAFLFDVKEGYCSHFATAACELLREMGIPARYVEGYVASDFEKSVGAQSAAYRSYVTEDKAHAWVEVYFHGLGWTQLEVTPGKYADEMYNADSATFDLEENTSSDTGTPGENESVPHPEETPAGKPADDLTTEETSDVEWFLRLVIITASVLLVGFLISLLVRRLVKKARDMMSERYRVIDRAKNPDAFADEKTDKHWLAKQLDDWIMDIFRMIGCEPQKGELPEEFVARMRRDYGEISKTDIGDVIEAMQKEEFGHGLTLTEMQTLAEYLEDIISSVYASLSPLQKIRIRYIKRRI